MMGLKGFRIANMNRLTFTTDFGETTTMSSSDPFEMLMFSYLAVTAKRCT